MLRVIAIVALMLAATVCAFISYGREVRKVKGAQTWGAVALGAYVIGLGLMG